MTKACGMVLVLASLCALPAPSLAADAKTALLASACAGCHGTDGNSPGTIPKLRGEKAQDLLEDMKEFKADPKSGTVMGRIASGYTDQEIEALARYFAEAKRGRP